MEKYHYEISYKPEELIPIVAELAEKYTGIDSTSVTYEKAEQLMDAVIYCISEYEKYGGNCPAIRELSPKEAYIQGFRRVKERVNEMKEIYHSLLENFDAYGNVCLRDTILKGIPKFLKWYDALYNPQNTILTLDYLVLKDLSGCTGIERVYEYVKCIFLEQKFLGRFERKYVMEILAAYSDSFREMPEDIYSIVFMNTIGHILLKKPLNHSGFTAEEYGKIQRRYIGQSSGEIEKELCFLTKNMVCELYGEDEELLNYMLSDLENMAVRIKNGAEHGNLDKIFLL